LQQPLANNAPAIQVDDHFMQASLRLAALKWPAHLFGDLVADFCDEWKGTSMFQKFTFICPYTPGERSGFPSRLSYA
jgi:hypothetical protein